MAIILSGVTLPQGMVWEDENTYSKVAQSQIRTLGGNVLVYSQQLFEGLPITLISLQDQGWMTKQQVLDIQALADVSGAVYALEIETQNFQVMFRHQEPPAFTASALIPRVTTNLNDYYTATIKLMTVA